MAAVAAALEAKECGAKVTVVKGKPGATALSSGAWDIAGNPLRHPSDPWQSTPSPLANIEQLIRRNPHHPYCAITENVDNLGEFLSRSVEKISQSLPYRIVGSVQQGFLALTPLGTLKATAFVPKSYGAGNFLTLQGARLLLVGFRGLASGSAPMATAMLKKKVGGDLGEIQAVELFPDLAFNSPFELAQKMDGNLQEFFYGELAKAVKKFGPTHVALPPVIGVESTAQIFSRLQETVGVPCFETLALTPSIPGLRLHKAMEQFLRSQATVVEGEATRFQADGRTIKRIFVRNKDKEEPLDVSQVVLAAGKYLSGGIGKTASFEEPLFHLPLGVAGKYFGKIYTGKLLADQFLADHPLFSVGVQTNHSLQPINEQNELVYENLWAAGSILAGTNPAVDHSGMGTAVATGTLAGRLASGKFASRRLAS